MTDVVVKIETGNNLGPRLTVSRDGEPVADVDLNNDDLVVVEAEEFHIEGNGRTVRILL